MTSKWKFQNRSSLRRTSRMLANSSKSCRHSVQLIDSAQRNVTARYRVQGCIRQRYKHASDYSKFSSASFAFRSASASRSTGTGTCNPFVSLPIHDISSSNSFSLLSSWTRYILGQHQRLERGEGYKTDILAASATASRVESSESLSFSSSVFANCRPLPMAAPWYP